MPGAPPQSRSLGGFELVSREAGLLLNNILLVVTAATILLGTLYPLVIDALGLGKLSVGPPYFNTVFIPLTAPLAVLVGIRRTDSLEAGPPGPAAADTGPPFLRLPWRWGLAWPLSMAPLCASRRDRRSARPVGDVQRCPGIVGANATHSALA